jgi:hypothetical protein
MVLVVVRNFAQIPLRWLGDVAIARSDLTVINKLLSRGRKENVDLPPHGVLL